MKRFVLAFLSMLLFATIVLAQQNKSPLIAVAANGSNK